MNSYIRYAAFLGDALKHSSHYHDCHQLIFVKEGLIEITINGRTKTAGSGDIVIISRFENHSIKVLSLNYERYLLRITNNIPYNDRIFSLFTNRPKSFDNIISAANLKEKLCWLFEKIVFEHKQSDNMSERMQNLLLSELMIEICRLIPEEIFPQNNEFDFVFKLQGEFEENYSARFSLQELANKYNVSISTLSHNFKKIAGVSVFEYIISCRIAAAKTMLSKTALPINEIVEKCGFSDNSNFSRTFKTLNGISPSNFRKQNKKG